MPVTSIDNGNNMTVRYPILDIWCDAVDMNQALSKVTHFVEDGFRLHTIFASNPEKNFSVPRDELLYRSFKSADLLIPDGIGIVMAAKLLYGCNLSRVPGCELMQEICGLAAAKNYRIFIYGAKPEVNQEAVCQLQKRFPNIRIVGSQHGYLPQKEMEHLVEQINLSEAQILFIALGSPRQEQWVARYKDRLRTVRVCQGIGGTLDVIAGTTKRAPEIYCKFGLEWFYRLLSEPQRLRRQWILPVFVLKVLTAKIKQVLVNHDVR